LCELRQSFLYLVRTFIGGVGFRTKSNRVFIARYVLFTSSLPFLRLKHFLSTSSCFVDNRFGLSFKKSGRLVSKGLKEALKECIPL
jgi:hypothetical protein